MTRRIPAARTPRRPRQKREEWCTCERQRVPGAGGQRCPRCGRRLQAYPEFSDEESYFGNRLEPGHGRETLRREGMKAAWAWFIGPHKLSKAKRS